MRRLGEYELVKPIGTGGMAEVWMGRRAAMGGASKAVAIKLLARSMVDDPEYRAMFVEEARLSMLLTHSNVVQVFDVGDVDGEIYMVMEWIDGLNLSELARNMTSNGQTLGHAVIGHIMGEVLRGLAYAHGLHHDGSEATIVHRDVSPQNVLLSVSGEVKLADFGVARLASEETSGLHVKGKLRYMAPEQLRGRSREPTVDLYAVGAMLHELLVGEKFRNTRDEADLYSMVLSGEYAPLPESTPPELRELTERLLEPDPKNRLQTAQSALEVLAGWPGYRNCSLRVGKHVREWLGVVAPRSGITSDSLARANTDPVDTQRSTDVDVPVERTTQLDSGATTRREDASSQTDVPATRTFAGSADGTQTAPAMAADSANDEGDSKLWMVFMGLAVVVALGFGIVGLGFGLGWFGGDDDPAQARAERAEATGAEPADELAAATGDGTETGPAEPDASTETGTAGAAETGGAENAGEAEVNADDGVGESGDAAADDAETGSQVAIAPEPTAKPEPKPQPKAAKVDVQFTTGNFMFVYVKVAGKELTLEPTASLSVKTGSHKVYVRTSKDEPWKQCDKRLKLEAGKRYKVKMKKPASFTLEKM